MGGASGIIMLLGLLRSKLAALLIGPTGVGLLAGFTAIQTMASTLSGFGMGAGAVRKISAAYAENDNAEIKKLAFILIRLSYISGIIGLCLLVVGSPMISKLTFGNYSYTLDIAALGIVALISNMSSAYLAVLQGMRRITELARTNVYSAAVGTISTLILYVNFGYRGIVPGIIFTSIAQLTFARHFYRKLNIVAGKQAWKQTLLDSKPIIFLGFSFMWGGLLVSGLSYFSIYVITQKESVHAVGLYSAAYAISGAFVNFILGAMSSDYYPRLAGLADDKVNMKNLVNQQTEIGLLLATPGLLAAIIFAPWIIVGLYSTDFELAAPLLQWFIVGALGRVISWPMGFIILALGKARMFFIFETSLNILHAILIYVGVTAFGIEGVAFAFCISNVVSILVLYTIARKTIDFSWSTSSGQLVLVSSASIIFGLILSLTASSIIAICAGLVFVLITTIFSLRILVGKVGRNSRTIKLLSRLPLVKSIIGA
jgi:enterobacterial common antigen flippase